MPELDLAAAVAALRAGKVIAYPTEAVFGLGCDPGNPAAVAKILQLKQRDAAKGLILIGAELAHFEPWLAPVDSSSLQRAQQTWPGPVTWVFPATEQAPTWLRGDYNSLAVRISAHPICRALCQAFGRAVVSTSANLSGQAPATTASQLEADFGNRIAGILPGELGNAARPSQIRDVLSGKILRS